MRNLGRAWIVSRRIGTCERELLGPLLDPIPGWRPWSLEDGSWGSRFDGDTRALPDDLVGCSLEVTTKGGDDSTQSTAPVKFPEPQTGPYADSKFQN